MWPWKKEKKIPGFNETDQHGLQCRPERPECNSYLCARWIDKSPVGPGCAEKVTALLLAEILQVITETEFDFSGPLNAVDELLQEFKKKGGDINGRTVESNREGGVERRGGSYQGCEPPLRSGQGDGVFGESFPGVDGEALDPLQNGVGVSGGSNCETGEQDWPALEESAAKIASFLKDNVAHSLEGIRVELKTVGETMLGVSDEIDNVHIAIQDCVELLKEK